MAVTPRRRSPRDGGDLVGASDEALVAGMAMGDDGATVAFVRRFQRRVYGLAASVLADATEASDVAQEVLVRAWRHAANFDPRKGTVEAWVLTITRNASVDALRRRRSIPTDPEVLVAMCRLDVEGPDHRVTQSDEARRVAAMVQGLPEEQRRAVLLAALQGRTAQDISEIEGIPLGTAKTRIRTGLIRVRQMMEGAA